MTIPPPLLPTRQQRQDAIYTVMLSVLAFLSLCGVVTISALCFSPVMNAQSIWALHMVIAVNLCFLAFEIAVLVIRWKFPASRKWPTITLNIVLLLSIPLGTIVGLYGLLKADRSIP